MLTAMGCPGTYSAMEVNIKNAREIIHSGQFMVSTFEAEEAQEEGIEVNEEKQEAETDVVYPYKSPRSPEDETGKVDTSVGKIDESLTSLFKTMDLAYKQKITSPKWNCFKGLKLRWKDKIRLNNVIWRCWHMQYILHKRMTWCQFSLDVDIHMKPEAIVLEGKYWKRRPQAVIAEYKKWRHFKKGNQSGDPPEIVETSELSFLGLEEMEWARSYLSTQGLNFDEKDSLVEGLDLSDVLFSPFTSNPQPFLFPNHREIARGTVNSDLQQPGLMQLQPDLPEFMDIVPEFLSHRCLPTVPEEDFFQSVETASLPAMSPNVPSPTPPRLHHQYVAHKERTSSGTYALSTRFNSPLNTPIPQQTFPNDNTQMDDMDMSEGHDLGQCHNAKFPNAQVHNEYSSGNRSSLQTPRPQSPCPSYRMTNEDVTSKNSRRRPLPLPLSKTNTNDVFCSIAPFVSQDEGGLSSRTFGRNPLSQPRSFSRCKSQQELDILQQDAHQQPPFALPKAVARRRSHSGSGPYTQSPKSPLASSSPGVLSQQVNTPYSSQEQARDIPFKSSSIVQLLKSEPYMLTPNQVSQPHYQTSLLHLSSCYNPISYHASSMSNTLLTTSALSLPTILSPTSNPNLVSIGPLTSSIPLLNNMAVSSLQHINYSKPHLAKIELSQNLLRNNQSVSNPPALITTNFTHQLCTIERKDIGSGGGGGSSTGIGCAINLGDIGKKRALLSSSKASSSSQSMYLPNVTLSPVTPSSIKAIQSANSQEMKLFVSDSNRSSLLVKESPLCNSDESPPPPPHGGTDQLSPQNRPYGYRPKSESDRSQYKEHRRVCHINAEQKRRYNIKNNFEMLHSLVPSVSQNPNAKVSKATMLIKGAQYIQQLQEERQSIIDKSEQLRKQIETLSNDISTAQSLLPATGAPLSHSRHNCAMREHYTSYVRERSLTNWKFYLLSLIGEPLMESFNEQVSTSSVEDLSRTAMAWLDQHCSLNVLRPVVSNAMRSLSTSTCILTQPERLSEDIFGHVTKQEGRQQPSKIATTDENNKLISNSFNAS